MTMRRFVPVVTVMMMLITATPAAAHHTDSMLYNSRLRPSCVDNFRSFCRTDNSTLTWFDESTISIAGRNTITNVLEGQFEPTHLTVSFQGTPAYTGTAETDIIYRRGTLPTDLLGETRCDDSINDEQCDQHYVTLSVASPDARVICHESGHAIGLTHGEDAAPVKPNGDNAFECLQTPYQEITAGVLGTHNTTQINATYP